MKMMDCSALETLVVNHEPIELIDFRSKNEFDEMHIPRARDRFHLAICLLPESLAGGGYRKTVFSHFRRRSCAS